MGTVCTSTKEKKYSKIMKSENDKHNNQLEGSEVNTQKNNISKDFLIYQLIKKEDQGQLFNYLTSNDIDINEYIFDNEMTILHRSIHLQTSSNFIEFLISKGAKIESVEIKTMNTPLYIAAINLNEEIVFTLLKYSPNIFHKNNENKDMSDILIALSKDNLPTEKENKLQKITYMIKEYKKKLEKTEQLD